MKLRDSSEKNRQRSSRRLYSGKVTLQALVIGLLAATGFASASSFPPLPALHGVHRVLFLGDSITYAGEYVDTIDAYVQRCEHKSPIEVINLGLPSENVSGLSEPNHAGGAFPRPDLHERLDRALARIKPDLVVACYGMNDGIYYPFGEERFQKYKDGIQWLRSKVLASHAKLWLVTPPPFDPQPVHNHLWPAGRSEYPSGHTYEGYDEVLGRYAEWLVTQRQTGWNVVDIHTPLDAFLAERRKTDPKFQFAGDGVHLNGMGHRLVARAILRAWGAPEERLPSLEGPLRGREKTALAGYENLVAKRQQILKDAWLTDIGHKRPGMTHGLPLNEANLEAAKIEVQVKEIIASIPPAFPGLVSDYHGFDQHNFMVDGVNATVVSPAALTAHSHRPWIWRAEFFDHRPELDLALLSRGFHLVYIEVGNTFGAPSAMKHWDAFYAVLTKTYGLSPKPTLEGLSRGGLYIYNWAVKHPKDVSVLYGDNPVCDFKSWPGGKGAGPGSPDDWKKLIHDYGFQSEAEAMAYKGNPIDSLAPLARAHVPIIHCAADADEVVPYAENTVILLKRYQELGGEIQVIVKHGFKHHPHGLDDPTPLVDFILAHTQR